MAPPCVLDEQAIRAKLLLCMYEVCILGVESERLDVAFPPCCLEKFKSGASIFFSLHVAGSASPGTSVYSVCSTALPCQILFPGLRDMYGPSGWMNVLHPQNRAPTFPD